MSVGAPAIKIANDVCSVCGKTVYPMDKLQADAYVFHKTCLKCAHCNVTLSLGKYAALEGKFYCKPHFKQLFMAKGNYNEGFGTEKHSKQWTPQAVTGFKGVEAAVAASPSKSTRTASPHPATSPAAPSPAASAAAPSPDPPVTKGAFASAASAFRAADDSAAAEKPKPKPLKIQSAYVGAIVMTEPEKKAPHARDTAPMRQTPPTSSVEVVKPVASPAKAPEPSPVATSPFRLPAPAEEPSPARVRPNKIVSSYVAPTSPSAPVSPASSGASALLDAPAVRPGTSPNKARPAYGTTRGVKVAEEKCIVCAKTVYPMDKISADEKTFHKACLRCTHCQMQLTLGKYAALEGKFYCKPHFKQLFALKGNYNEGFGTEKHSKLWQQGQAGGAPQEGNGGHGDGAAESAPAAVPAPVSPRGGEAQHNEEEQAVAVEEARLRAEEKALAEEEDRIKREQEALEEAEAEAERASAAAAESERAAHAAAAAEEAQRAAQAEAQAAAAAAAAAEEARRAQEAARQAAEEERARSAAEAAHAAEAARAAAAAAEAEAAARHQAEAEAAARHQAEAEARAVQEANARVEAEKRAREAAAEEEARRQEEETRAQTIKRMQARVEAEEAAARKVKDAAAAIAAAEAANASAAAAAAPSAAPKARATAEAEADVDAANISAARKAFLLREQKEREAAEEARKAEEARVKGAESASKFSKRPTGAVVASGVPRPFGGAAVSTPTKSGKALNLTAPSPRTGGSVFDAVASSAPAPVSPRAAEPAPVAVSPRAPPSAEEGQQTGAALLAADADEKARKEEERLARFAGGRF